MPRSSRQRSSQFDSVEWLGGLAISREHQCHTLINGRFGGKGQWRRGTSHNRFGSGAPCSPGYLSVVSLFVVHLCLIDNALYAIGHIVYMASLGALNGPVLVNVFTTFAHHRL